MEVAGVTADDIGGIILALGFGDVRSPSTACIVQKKLEAFNAWGMDANTACMGFIWACQVGSKFVADGSCDAFLAIGADIASRTKFEAELVTMLGGRAAEEIVFDRITTGASNDLERATDLVRKMVMEYGMSDDLGPLTYGERDEMIFLGRSISEHRNYSFLSLFDSNTDNIRIVGHLMN